MSIFTDFYNCHNEVHLRTMDEVLVGLKSLIEEFNRTKSGVNYYSEKTEEEIEELNITYAEAVIRLVDDYIKKDRFVYRVIAVLYEDEINEMREVLAKH